MKPQRIASIDALRGFDMLWIAGGEAIIIALSNITGLPVFNWLSFHMEHAEWAGFRFYDNIFPLFLFLAGVSFPFSLAKRKFNKDSNLKIYRHIFTRVLILIFLGCLVNGMLANSWNGFSQVRYASVLGRIGLAWGIAAVLTMHFDVRKLIIITGSILVGYWLSMMFIPVPGYGAGVMTVEGNLASYIDRLYLPGVLYCGVMDPEGLFSTIPAVATALLGVLTGYFIKSTDKRFSPFRKAMLMALSGILLIVLGQLWSLHFPIIKSIWTSSFVLMAGGFDLLLLSLFYLIIDVWHWHKWAFAFTVIGMNSITIYLCVQGALRFSTTRDFFFTAPISLFSPLYQPLVAACLLVLVEWGFLYFLYKKGIFFKV